MPYHYRTLKAQIAADVAASQGDDWVVYFGKPRKKLAEKTAVVRTTVRRDTDDEGLREVVEAYSFDIAFFLPLPDPNKTDIEDVLFAAADAFTMRVAKFDADGVPLYDGPYAGVGILQRVTEVTPGEDGDSDKYASVSLTFECRCSVYQ